MAFSPWNLEVLWMLALPLFGSIAFGIIAAWAERTSARNAKPTNDIRQRA